MLEQLLQESSNQVPIPMDVTSDTFGDDEHGEPGHLDDANRHCSPEHGAHTETVR